MTLQNDLHVDNSAESSTSWLSSLPEELQKAESLGKFKDIPSLASSYLEAEKSLKSQSYKSLSRPQATEIYGIYSFGPPCS